LKTKQEKTTPHPTTRQEFSDNGTTRCGKIFWN